MIVGLNFFSPVISDRFVDPHLVIGVRGHTYVCEKVGILLEDEVMKELSLQAKSMGVFQSSIHKLTVLLIYYVVIQNNLLILLCFYHFVRLVLHGNIAFHVAQGAEPYPDKTFLDKVHLVHFVRLIAYYHVFVY